MNSNEFKLELRGLDCANCANKIEAKVDALPQVKEATINFSVGLMTVVKMDGVVKEELIEIIKKIVNDLEPDVQVKEFNKLGTKPKKEEHTCNCQKNSCCGDVHNHEHSHEENKSKREKIVLGSGIILLL